MGFWYIIDPAERRNLIPNPSLEYGTAGYGTITSGTVGSVSGSAYFGAWAGSVATGSNGTAGVLSGSFTSTTGVDYTWSLYMHYPDGTTFIAGVSDGNGNSLRGSIVGTGYGRWARYVGSFTESTGGARRIAVRKNGITGAMYWQVDGLQVEVGSLTTYIDGDRGAGYMWDGLPHLSSSYRAGSARGGGSAIPLSDIGVYVIEAGGIGMPDVTNVMQDYAVLDGAFYQRTRAQARSLTLVANVQGTTWQDYHAARQRVISLVKPDRVPSAQPVRLLYSGAGGTTYLDAVYDSGLQMGRPEGFSETFGMRMIAPDPYWYSEQEEGTALAPFATLGSANYIAYRDPQGRWGTLGNAGTTTNGFIRAMAWYGGGTLIVAGGFGSAGGTVARYIAQYAGGAWGTLTGGTLGAGIGAGTVTTLQSAPSGTLFVLGQFQGDIAGTAQRYTATWNGAWGTFTNGSIIGNPYASLLVNGTLFVGGDFQSAGGTTAQRIAQYTNGSWGTLTGGTLSMGVGLPSVLALAWNNGALFVGGAFSTVAGTGYGNDSLGGIAIYAGSWGTLTGGVGTGIQPLGSYVGALQVLPNAQVAVGGYFGNAGGGTALGVALASQRSLTNMGLGFGSAGTQGEVRGFGLSPRGELWAGGALQFIGSVRLPGGLARWTGAAWVVGDSNLSPDRFLFSPDGTMFAAGFGAGGGTVASIAQVMLPPGAANSPARLVLRNTSGGTARVWQLLNTTTNDSIWLDLSLEAGETATLALYQGSPAFTSSVSGNIIGRVVAGSNLASWKLAGGTNIISFYSDNASLRADLIAAPRFWSADGTL